VYLKLLHTGDVHLGAKFSSLGEKGKEHRKQIEKTFENVIDLAIEKNVNAFLVAGDLFDNTNPSQSSLSFVKRQFKRLQDNGIWVIVIPGTHDRLVPGSVFAKTKFRGDKIIVFQNDVESTYVSELDCTFYARPNTSNKSLKSPLEGIRKKDEGEYHIALAHGSYQIEGKSSKDDYPITDKDIKDSGLDYLALAHWHNPLEVSQGKSTAYYCGSPEIVALDQKNGGTALMVELEDRKCNVEVLSTGRRLVKSIKVDIEKIKSLENLEELILKNANEDLILHVDLIGIRIKDLIIDVDQLVDSLCGKFFSFSVSDQTILDLSTLNENSFPENYILGRFIKEVKENNELTDEQKGRVLGYGIPLLQGEELL